MDSVINALNLGATWSAVSFTSTWLNGWSVGINLQEGTYLQLTGPNFESPHEVRMCRILGADAVGMHIRLTAAKSPVWTGTFLFDSLVSTSASYFCIFFYVLTKAFPFSSSPSNSQASLPHNPANNTNKLIVLTMWTLVGLTELKSEGLVHFLSFNTFLSLVNCSLSEI